LLLCNTVFIALPSALPPFFVNQNQKLISDALVDSGCAENEARYSPDSAKTTLDAGVPNVTSV
jgi:hypothetical protein